MPKIIINGFVNNSNHLWKKLSENCVVCAFTAATFNTKNAIKVFDAKPNRNGIIIVDVTKDFTNSTLTIVVIYPGFEHENYDLKIKEKGSFLTVQLKFDDFHTPK